MKEESMGRGMRGVVEGLAEAGIWVVGLEVRRVRSCLASGMIKKGGGKKREEREGERKTKENSEEKGREQGRRGRRMRDRKRIDVEKRNIMRRVV